LVIKILVSHPETSTRQGALAVSISERKKELKRRRHRRQKLARLEKRLAKATVSEKSVIVEKVRNLTPGSEDVLNNWNLSSR